MIEIYREFPFYKNIRVAGIYGSISVFVYTNYIKITIDYFIQDVYQTWLIIKYAENQRKSIYEIIKNILDKISQTMYYDNFEGLMYHNKKPTLINEPYIEGENSNPTEPTDLILYCFPGKPTDKEWNAPDDSNCGDSYWLPFTKENMKFVDIIDDTNHIFKKYEDKDVNYSDDESSNYCENIHHYHLLCEIGENGEFDDTEFKDYIWTRFLNPDTCMKIYPSSDDDNDDNDSEYNSEEDI